ncbi:hypothetical protein OG439_07240 [Amycolatopsis sp. NBC_01307]|uniref:hypothetical protein n=1 Tax=Amycolatopsis sp. NBC_01307 TaxID=2903561 RepID=UPI002E0FD031|nr:hypothetical protein OG439_07240 [Amycolatopsis sp. NBC_01307]
MRLKRFAGAIVALVVSFTLASVTPASAQPAPQGDYCLQALEGGPATCFASEQALASYQKAVAVSPLLTVFDDVNYTGGYKNYYSAYGRAYCDDSLTPNEASDGDLSNDYFDTGATVDKDISSFVILPGSTCLVTFYDQTGFHGNHVTKGVNCPDMRTCFASGNWNNRARSLAVT